MEKLKLRALGLSASEVLSRTQMKNVLGGGSGSGSGGCSVPITTCSSDSDCGGNCPKCCTVNSSLKGCATTCG